MQTSACVDRAFGWVCGPTLLRCPALPELSKWKQAAMWGTPVSRLRAPPTAAVQTNGRGTPASVNLVKSTYSSIIAPYSLDRWTSSSVRLSFRTGFKCCDGIMTNKASSFGLVLTGNLKDCYHKMVNGNFPISHWRELIKFWITKWKTEVCGYSHGLISWGSIAPHDHEGLEVNKKTMLDRSQRQTLEQKHFIFLCLNLYE